MSQLKIQKINNCRICNAENLRSIFALDQMPFTDEFVKKDKIGSEYLAKIEIGICTHCGSVQNLNDTDMSDYYNDYTYTVQSSLFAMNFMSTLANRIKQAFFLTEKNPSVIEIGSGSGEQLAEFKKNGFDVLGIEPSRKLSDYANSIGVKTLTTFFDENTKEAVDPQFAFVDVVISSYTFDHIPRPVEVLSNIHHILKDGGLIVLEVHDLDLIIERNEFCLFEHEHYTYLNERTIRSLLAQNGFEVETFELLKTNEKRGNSLLVVARKAAFGSVGLIIDVRREVERVENLSKNICNAIGNFDQWLEVHRDNRIAAYGAGGRGIMTIAALKNAGIIRFILDKNPKASGIFAPKSHLPVYGIEALAKERPDIIVVFSFGYFDEIVEELTTKYRFNSSQFISILDIMEEGASYAMA